jgi:hypothetical protein
MKILLFLHGTVVMQKNGIGKLREERVRQSIERDASVLDYIAYVPVGNCVSKLKKWESQGAKIFYLSSHQNAEDVEKDKQVLRRFDFPDRPVYWRHEDQEYAELAARIMPDVLIEDDCESIGGEREMTYTNIDPVLKPRIRHLVVKEFEGIDHLPDNISLL